MVWNPYHSEYSYAFYVMQNNFLRYLYCRSFGRYPELGFSTNLLRRIFDIPSLRGRRDLHSLMVLYKVCNGMIFHPYYLSRVGIYVPVINRERYFSLFITRARTSQFYFSPINRAFRLFNIM